MRFLTLITLSVHHHLFAACAVVEIVCDAGGASICEHGRRKRECVQCIRSNLPADHPSLDRNLTHVTTATPGDLIVKDGKLRCAKALHGKTFAVWAAGTFADALTHALTASRHHAE